jgi:hypothetical protein
MAILKKSLSAKEPKRPTPIFAMKYDELLKRSQRQVALAREMREKAEQMIDDAIGMRARPLRLVLP